MPFPQHPPSPPSHEKRYHPALHTAESTEYRIPELSLHNAVPSPATQCRQSGTCAAAPRHTDTTKDTQTHTPRLDGEALAPIQPSSGDLGRAGIRLPCRACRSAAAPCAAFAVPTKSARHNFEAKLFFLYCVYFSQALFTCGKRSKLTLRWGWLHVHQRVTLLMLDPSSPKLIRPWCCFLRTCENKQQAKLIAWRGGIVRSKVQKPVPKMTRGKKGDCLQKARLCGVQAMRCQVGGNGEVCIAKRAGQALEAEARGTVAMGSVWFGRQESTGKRLLQPSQLGLSGTDAPVFFLVGPSPWFSESRSNGSHSFCFLFCVRY